MSQYDGFLFLALSLTGISFLYFLTRYIDTLPSRRKRVLVPLAAIILYVGALSQLNGIMSEATIGGTIIIVLPTLAVLTIFPFAESDRKMENRGVLIAIISIPLTITVLFYLWARGFSGIPTVFLPTEALIPKTNKYFFSLGFLFLYAQLLIICGAFIGALAPAIFQKPCDAFASGLPYNRGQIVSIILFGIGLIFLNSLVVGFLAIFLHLVLREVPVRAVRVALPVVVALLIAYVTSGMVPQEPISFSLFVLLFLALGIMTLFPVFEKYFQPRELTVIYFCSTATVITLAVLFHDPAANSFEILTRGLSTIIDSGIFAGGTSVADGMVNKLALFGSAFVISAIMYAALALTMPRIRTKQSGGSSARPVPEESSDQTGGNEQQDHTGHTGRTEGTKPEQNGL